jgi:hypothetical protein
MVSERLFSKGLKAPLKFSSIGYQGEFFKTITRDSHHISLAIIDEIKDELLRGEFKTLNLPDDIYLDLDVIAYESHLSTSLARQFIACLKASFEP